MAAASIAAAVVVDATAAAGEAVLLLLGAVSVRVGMVRRAVRAMLPPVTSSSMKHDGGTQLSSCCSWLAREALSVGPNADTSPERVRPSSTIVAGVANTT